MDILFSFRCVLLRQEEAERVRRRMESELNRNRFADVRRSFWANVYAEALMPNAEQMWHIWTSTRCSLCSFGGLLKPHDAHTSGHVSAV